MSKNIDNKVVSMEFDNSKFEKPAKETMSTIDKLKEALQFNNVGDGLSHLNNAIRAVTFTPIEKGIDSVYAKFTFFERFTIQLYDRLANKILDIGKSIAQQSFTVPISTGKSEYEEKMGAVQTIMASSKRSLADVNKTLEELNQYADDTIYSFRDMTTNIGKFTNAGVELEDAVAAIKGISNEAALAGANANEASRAMYNFAQALSSGAVKLIDWKSIENANMATKEFKQQLIDTAVNMKILTKQTDGCYRTLKGKTFTATSNFNEALQDQWMTSQVLVETLKNYATEETDIGRRANAAAKEVKTFSMLMDTLKESLQSGWAVTWETVIGDFDEAKHLWTDLSGVLGGLIDRINNTRNAMLKAWKEFGGRDAMLKGISNLWNSLASILGAVRDGFRSVFPPMTGKRLADISERFRAFTERLKPSNELLDKVRRTARGFFSVLGIGVDAIKAFYNAFAPLFFKAFGFAIEKITKITGGLGDFTTRLRRSIKDGQVFEKVFGGIASVLSVFGKAFKAVYEYIEGVVGAFKTDGFKAGLIAIKDGIVNLFQSVWKYISSKDPISAIKNLGVKMAATIEKWPIGRAIMTVLRSIKDFIVNSPVWDLCAKVVEGFVNTIQKIINKFRNIDTSATKEFTEKVETGFKPLTAIKNFFLKIWDGILKFWEWAGPTLKAIGSFIGKAFANLYNDIRGVVQKSDLTDTGVFMAGGGLGMFLISLGELLVNFAKVVKDAGSTAKNFNKILLSISGAVDAAKMKIYSSAMKDIAVGILALAGALFILSALPADALARATASITLLFSQLAAAIKGYSLSLTAMAGVEGGEGNKKGMAGALLAIGVQMAAMAAAITLLTANMIILALVPWEAIVKGLAIIILMMRSLSHEATSMSKNGGTANTLGPLIGLAIALNAMVLPLAILSLIAKFNSNGLWEALGVVEILLATLGAIAVGMGAVSGKINVGSVAAFTGPILAMAAALYIILKAITKMAIVAALASTVGKGSALEDAVRYVKSILKIIVKMAVTMVALGAAVKLFQGSELSIFSKVAGGRAAITGNGAAIEGASTSSGGIFKFGSGGGAAFGIFAPVIGAILGIGLAMMAVAGAVAILSIAAAAISDENWNKVTEFTFIIAGLFAAVAVVTSVVNSCSKKIEGSEIKAGNVNAKISLFPPLLSFAMSVAAFIVAIAGAARLMVNVPMGKIWTTFAIAGGIIALVAVLAAKIGNSKKTASALDKLSEAIEKLAKAGLILMGGIALIVAAFALLAKSGGEGIDKFNEALDKWLIAIRNKRQQIVEAIAMLVGMVIESILRGIATASMQLATSASETMTALLDRLIDSAPQILSKLFKLIGMVCDSIVDNAPVVTEKLVVAIIAIVDGVAGAIDKHAIDIVMAIDRLIESIAKMLAGLWGRLIGVSKSGMDEFINNNMGVFKFLTTFGLGAAGIHAMAKNSNRVITTWSNLYGSISKFWTGLKRVSDNVGNIRLFDKLVEHTVEGTDKTVQILETGLITSIKSIPSVAKTSFGKLDQILSAHKFATAFGAISAAIIGVSIALRVVTNEMKVVTEEDKKAADSFRKMTEQEKKYQDVLKGRRDAMDSAGKPYEEAELTAEKLNEVIDADGKIIEGKEKQFELLRDQLSGVINLQIAEDGQLKILNEQGEALDYQKETMDEILKRKRLQAQLDSQSEKYAEAIKMRESGELSKNIVDAEKELKAFEKEEFSVLNGTSYSKGEFIKYYNQLQEYIKKQGLSTKDAMAKVGFISGDADSLDAQLEYKKLSKQYTDITGRWYQLSNAVSSAKNIWARNESFIDNYDDAVNSWGDDIDVVAEKIQKLYRGDMSERVMKTVDDAAITAMSDLEGALQKLDDFAKTAVETGEEWNAELANKVADGANTIADTLRAAGYGDQVNAIFARYHIDAGRVSYEEYKDSYVENMKHFAEDVAPEITTGWRKLGHWTAEGFVLGLHEKNLKPDVDKKLQDEVIDTANTKLGIRSPSKVFAQIGRYCIEGLKNGLDDESSDLSKATAAMANASVAAFQAALVSGDGMSWTPMIDTAGVQNGSDFIQRSLRNLQSGSLDTSMSTKLAASVDTSRLQIDNSRIIDLMLNLHDDVTFLSSVMSNLQVVMDTGATVGALAPAMDEELGRRIAREERGV